jgi:hypothetical protein
MQEKMMKKTSKSLWKLRVLGVIVTFAPVLLEIFIHKDVYFRSRSAGWALTIGGIIAVVLVALAMVGKLGSMLGSDIRVVGTIFVMAMLMEPIMVNVKLLSFLLLCGMVANALFVKPKLARLTRRKANEETAEVLREALNK